MRKRTILGVLVALALAIPAVALAASAPVKGGAYGSKTVAVVVSKDGKSVKFVTTYCHKVGPVTISKIPLEPGTFWHFSFTGKTKAGPKASVTGLFSSRKKVTGDMKVGSCAKKTFTATFR